MAPETTRPRAIKIAILAMGGEGGGVLADWIVDLAEHGNHLVQTTSVPGVAQRTGATIYYLELFPRAAALAAGKDPVLALMPVPGDVDIVIASELMEAGRAVQRGLVLGRVAPKDVGDDDPVLLDDDADDELLADSGLELERERARLFVHGVFPR